MRRIVSLAPALVVLLTAFSMLAVGPMLVRSVGYAATGARIELASQVLEDDDILARIDRAQTALAEKVMPSVVHVDARRGRWSRGGASGAGWVYDQDGHVITNAHVIRGSDAVRVQFENGLTADAELIGADPYTDIAVLKIPASPGLFPFERAPAESIRRGQNVFAFGSPFGFKYSMSKGIVSGLGRDPSGAVLASGFTNFIQSDASVNPGNSGGPLADTDGRIIGMNVAIATGRDTDGATIEGGQSAGISFAIPIPVVESVVNQIITTGQVRRGFLGISFNNGPTDEEEVITDVGFWGLGVPVGGVTRGEAAERAGVQQDDLIVKFNGDRVPSRAVLRSWISSTSPGETIDLTVFRDGAFIDLKVTLGEFPRQALSLQPILRQLNDLGIGFGRGLSVEDRPFVQFVQPNGVAAGLGIRPGMLIMAVEDQEVQSIEELTTALENAGFLTGQSVDIVAGAPMSNDRPEQFTIRSVR